MVWLSSGSQGVYLGLSYHGCLEVSYQVETLPAQPGLESKNYGLGLSNLCFNKLSPDGFHAHESQGLLV